MGTSDQRAHPRIPLVLQVQYPEQEGFVADATENLSAAGAFVRTERPLQVGDLVPLVLSFPGLLAPLEITAAVAWVRPASGAAPAGVGLRIPDDRADDRARLNTILTRIAAEQAASPKAGAGQAGYRILLVEDNPHIMEMYEYVMKKLARGGNVPIDVGLAKDGFDALEKLRAGHYDLVVTDLYMPVLDGFEFIRRLRQDEATQRIPVIAISAGGADTQSQAKGVGADVYLRKPVRFVDVVETVRALLKL